MSERDLQRVDPQALKTKTIGVLMGGLSGEREVSFRSGENCLRALLSRGYRAVRIDAVRDVARRIEDAGIEVAFLALHGRYGEDGTIQGLLEMMGIPYTGSGVLASALAMNKIASKKVVRSSGFPTPDHRPIGMQGSAATIAADVEAHLGLPVMVKPVEEGSSLGVSKCRDAAGGTNMGPYSPSGLWRAGRLPLGYWSGTGGWSPSPSLNWCPRTNSTTMRRNTHKV